MFTYLFITPQPIMYPFLFRASRFESTTNTLSSFVVATQQGFHLYLQLPSSIFESIGYLNILRMYRILVGVLPNTYINVANFIAESIIRQDLCMSPSLSSKLPIVECSAFTVANLEMSTAVMGSSLLMSRETSSPISLLHMFTLLLALILFYFI